MFTFQNGAHVQAGNTCLFIFRVYFGLVSHVGLPSGCPFPLSAFSPSFAPLSSLVFLSFFFSTVSASRFLSPSLLSFLLFCFLLRASFFSYLVSLLSWPFSSTLPLSFLVFLPLLCSPLLSRPFFSSPPFLSFAPFIPSSSHPILTLLKVQLVHR